MTSQIRRASTSIAANVAEGYGRGRGEYIQFVRYALGSLNELETHLEVCIRVGLLTEDALTKLRPYLEEEGRMLTGIIQKAAEKKEQAS